MRERNAQALARQSETAYNGDSGGAEAEHGNGDSGGVEAEHGNGDSGGAEAEHVL